MKIIKSICGFNICVLTYLYIFSFQVCNSLSGSFYGDSFIHVPLEDATAETAVKLQFLTHRPNGLLLLAAGNTDYCAIELESGTVLVRIDLGSGEAILRSPPGLIFNDLRWHKVQVIRKQAEVELKIDEIYITTEQTPGRLFELNIQHGVYLGGIRTDSQVFFGLFKKYRGCLEEVVFNMMDILKNSKEHTDPMNRYGVTWDCSSEFSATSEIPISFLSANSFLAFPGLTTRPEIVRFTFDIRTRSQNALFLYHSGRAYQSDFLVIEILNGQISMTVNKGNGAIEFVSRKNIADGVWHQIEVVIDPINIRLAVDGLRKERRTNFGENQFLDLDGYLYVGGLDVKTRAKAMRYQLPSLAGSNAGGGSVIGCMQNFKINGDLYGFREADVTKNIQPKCVWSFPCNNMPCVEGAKCIEEGYYHYQCECDRENCYRTGNGGNISVLPDANIIHVQDIVVREGESSVITLSNINLLVDYDGYGFVPIDVIYKVVNSPEYGVIDVRNQPQINNQMQSNNMVIFTQDDLLNSRVIYVHDDSESYTDSVGIELAFKTDEVPDANTLPAKFLQTYGITLMVLIAPWNDKPVLYLPAENSLILVENTFVIITSDLIEAEDRDDRPRNLEYTVQYQQGHDVGYFEIADILGTRARITRFTQEDINEHRIKFVHRGAVIQNFRMQVSDGKDTSEPQMLKVSAVPLKLTLEANTGLELLSGGIAMFSETNLSYSSNAHSQHIDIRYHITDTTYFGEIQRRQLNLDKWITTVDFTQEDIDKGRMRYQHFPMELPETDYFHYRVHAMDVTTQDYQFFIYITPVRVNLTKNVKLILDGVKEKIISVDNLRSFSTVESHSDSEIVYSILNPPAHGDIFKLGAGANHKVKLFQDSNFTQNDINKSKIIYRLHRMSRNMQKDHFQFRLLIPGGDDSSVNMFDIMFEPKDTEDRFINNLLTEVVEGDKKRISMDDLYVETHQFDHFKYTVTSSPKHGVLQIIDPVNPDAVKIEVLNASTFTNEHIKNGKLYYSHDDSENSEDNFAFTAVPDTDMSGNIKSMSSFSGTFDIIIDLQNDNLPHRVNEKVFNVVLNRGRAVTPKDLKFLDPDKDFDASNLEYSWSTEIENGEFVNVSNHNEKLEKFSQSDIERGGVYFIHSGPRYGRSVLWVSDGHHRVSTLLEVRASDPFISITNNTGLLLEKGQAVVIMPKNLCIGTNLDVTDDDIKFVLEVPPSHGDLLRNENLKNRFTMKDVRNQRMVYRHDNSNFFQDSFRFTARIDDIQVQGVMDINITSEDDVQPPTIVINKILTVEELDRVAITKQYLKTEYSQFSDSEIMYYVTKKPVHGKLVFKSSGGTEVTVFSQDDVNRKRLQYHNIEAGYLNDNFLFDVSNGLSALSQVAFLIDILPVTIPLKVKDFKVSEGQGHVLSMDVLKVTNRHFINEGLQYFIVKEPSSGWIENMDNPLVKLVQFTHMQVINEQIYYEHDGNDTIWDEFSVMVKSSTSNKQSNPHTVHVTVIPSNDQTPKVVTNKPLEVWVSSITTITMNHLKAIDPDSPPEHLMYVITKPSNGDVVLESNRVKSITNFTQAHVNRGEVMFLHTGEMAGLFQFQVSDGTNRGKRHTFEIRANNLQLTLSEKNLLEVFPSVLQPITSKHLKAYTNDENQIRQIVYSLQSKPIKGILLMRYQNDSDSLDEVVSFTQDEIDKGLIAYKHMTPMSGAGAQYDHFIFDVTTAYATGVTLEMFAITISYDYLNSDNVNNLLQIVPVSVAEGGEVVITWSNLNGEKITQILEDGPLKNPSVHFNITSIPKHGSLFIRQENVTISSIFSERNLASGQINYKHDHSETLWDAFYFVVEIEYIEAGEKKTISPKGVVLFNITILPVNDQKYQVLTNFPFIELVQGFAANITSAELLTEDPDTPPESIVYKIADGPENGYIVLRDDPDIPIRTFTQKDVNMGKVIFIQDKRSMDSGAFYFSVTDNGQFEERYLTFIIRVHPLTLEVKKLQDVHIMQGHVSAFLSHANFNITTNGDKNRVFFNVTRPPMYGQLYMKDKSVNQFSGKNIEQKQVAYVQTDLSVAKDSFEFNIFDIQNVIVKKKMIIRVLPKLKRTATEPFQVKPGETVQLSVAYLDASDLAKQTNSVPMYVITQQPKYGEIVKLLRYREINKRDTNKQTRLIPTAVSNFSHSDVVESKIQYRAKEIKSSVEEKDGFGFLLTAENVQPAPDFFEVIITSTVKPVLTTTVKPIMKKAPQPPEETDDGKSEMSSKKARTDHITIVVVVVVVTLVVIICFIIYTCIKKKRKRKEKLAFKGGMKAAEKEEEKMPDPSSNPYADPYQVNIREKVDQGDVDDAYRDDRYSKYCNKPIPIIITSETDDLANTERPSSGASTLRSRSMSFERPKPDKRNIGSQPKHSSFDDGLDEQYSGHRSPESIPESSDMSRIMDSSDYTQDSLGRGVPTCKVTPLCDSQDSIDKLNTSSRDSTLPKRGEVMKFNWEQADPELLQHCRKTNPVLHKTKHWV